MNLLEGFDDQEDTPSDPSKLDDFPDEFDNEKLIMEEDSSQADESEPPFWRLSGSLNLGISYSYAHSAPDQGEPDYRGLSRLQPALHLDLDITISDDWKALISGKGFYDLAYVIKGRDKYNDGVLNEYEKEAEFREVYLQGPLSDNLDLKIGRQIVVWGKSDNIRVTDILNPLDMREPGIVDIKDLRIPVTMTRLDYYFRKWSLSGIAVHEIRFNKIPVYGSEFYPLNIPLPDEKKPSTLDNTEYAFALNGIFSGWDISFYGALFFNDLAHVEIVSFLNLERRHSRLSMIGSAMNIALGNWLLKSEAAYLDGLEFFALPEEKLSRFDILAGFEYSGIPDTMISLEAVNRHINNYNPRLMTPPDNTYENEFQWALRYSGDFLHDTLHIVILASIFGETGDKGSFQRFSAKYDMWDAFSLTAGLVIFQSGDKAEFRRIGDNDRLFIEAKYSF